jgi:hypothetical protein
MILKQLNSRFYVVSWYKSLDTARNELLSDVPQSVAMASSLWRPTIPPGARGVRKLHRGRPVALRNGPWSIIWLGF